MIRTMSAIMLVASAGLLTAAVEKRRADADALIAARQAAFELSASTFGSVKATIDAGGDVSKVALPGQGDGQLGTRVAGTIPSGKRWWHHRSIAERLDRPRRL